MMELQEEFVPGLFCVADELIEQYSNERNPSLRGMVAPMPYYNAKFILAIFPACTTVGKFSYSHRVKQEHVGTPIYTAQAMPRNPFSYHGQTWFTMYDPFGLEVHVAES